jgi:hypothetical protein
VQPPLLQAFPFQAHWGRWRYTCFLQLEYLFTVHVGSGPSPLSCGVFLPPPLLQAFPLLVAEWCHCSCLLWPACLFTVPWGIAPPPSWVLRTPCPLCYMSFLLLFIIHVLFCPWVGGQSVQGAMLIWPRVVCGSTATPT